MDREIDRDQYWYEHYQELVEALGFKSYSLKTGRVRKDQFDIVVNTHEEMIEEARLMAKFYGNG